MDLYLAVPDPSPLGPALLGDIRSFRFKGIRVDVSEDLSIARAQAESFVTTTVQLAFPEMLVNFLVLGGTMRHANGDPWRASEIETRLRSLCGIWSDLGYFLPARRNHPAIELANEPDIAHDLWKKHPEDLGRLFLSCYHIVRDFSPTAPVLTPSVSNLLTEKNRGIDYLEKMAKGAQGFPVNCVISFHRYPVNRFFTTPHKGFKTRVAELEAVRAVAGMRPIWNTETGWAELNGDYRLSDLEVCERLTDEIEFHAANEVDALTIYQMNAAEIFPQDDQDTRRLKTYGLRGPTEQGWKWRPQAYAVRDTVERLGLV